MFPSQYARKQKRAEAKARDPYEPIRRELKLVCKAVKLRFGDIEVTYRRRCKEPLAATGRAWWALHKLHFSIGTNCDRATIAVLACHEVAHLLARGDGHAGRWRSQFVHTVFEAYGVELSREGRQDIDRSSNALHGALEEALRCRFQDEAAAK